MDGGSEDRTARARNPEAARRPMCFFYKLENRLDFTFTALASHDPKRILQNLLFSTRKRRLRRRSGAAGEHLEIFMSKYKILLIQIMNLTDHGTP